MVESFLHPEFRLNGEFFSSEETLRVRMIDFLESGKDDRIAIGKFILEWLDAKDYISVKTSGSTGIPKNITLKKIRVCNSATATVEFFGLNAGTKALLCLSAEYIAGKMMLVRAMIAGWDIYLAPPGKNPLAAIHSNFDFTAMVPYQVHHSLPDLHKVKKLIVGGGAVSRALEVKLQKEKTRAFATYGMTETISHVAIRCLNGANRSSVFQALPGIEFSQDKNSCLQINAPRVLETPIATNDVVDLISPISFTIRGRIDNVINSGGVKIHPEGIEERLAEYIKESFFISSETDEFLGERVVLILESKEKKMLEDYKDILQVLQPYEKPKKLLTSPQFIYTETGKIRRKDTLRSIKDINS